MVTAAPWATIIITAMIIITDDLARLRLAQYLSPAFPVGSFAWSQGLEWAIDQRVVTEITLSKWLFNWLEYGTGWTDAVLLALSLQDGADYTALDNLARAACISLQRLTETTEQGAAFAANIGTLTTETHPPAALPVAFGRACRIFPLPQPEIIAAYTQAQAAMLISAVIRFMPLGSQKGQRILTELQPAILQTATRAAKAGDTDLASSTWGADIAAMSHETMQVRIFRS